MFSAYGNSYKQLDNTLEIFPVQKANGNIIWFYEPFLVIPT